VNAVTGAPRWMGCVIGGAVIVLYFTTGGLHGSARVNLVQLVVKLAGFAVAIPLLVSRVGGLDRISASPALPPTALDFWGGNASVGFLSLLVPAFMISPGLLQKAYGGKDERAVRTGFAANALVLMVFGFVPALVGMVEAPTASATRRGASLARPKSSTFACSRLVMNMLAGLMSRWTMPL